MPSTAWLENRAQEGSEGLELVSSYPELGWVSRPFARTGRGPMWKQSAQPWEPGSLLSPLSFSAIDATLILNVIVIIIIVVDPVNTRSLVLAVVPGCR